MDDRDKSASIALAHPRRSTASLGIYMKHLRKLAAIIATIYVIPVSAACLLQDYSVSSEFSRSGLVALGTVLSEASVADAQGPDGIGGMTYRVAIEHIFRGQPAETVRLFSENSSGRFHMQVGRKYILFASAERGTYSVDNCGNSADLERGGAVIAAVRKLAASAGT
jgi:hypothetical protein